MMRKFILLLILITLSRAIYAGSTFFFNEFDFSLNRTFSLYGPAEGKFGFGCAVNHVSNNEGKTNFVLGIEYNRTSQFHESGDAFHYASETDVTYDMNDISILIGPRFLLNKDKTIFINFNGFCDLPLRTRISGTSRSWAPDSNGNPQWKTSKYVKKSNIMRIDLGPSLGFGAALTHNLLLKMSCRVGLRPTNELTDLSKNYVRLIISYRL